ncbi:hypothetical protein [Winogradskya humida]|uniref:hypothetical protein n=1 Tax=Winogradskya humida TaxID=113566 RepID=UPI0019443E56|nr:hypothetical protein [Actinoplanes humidus]
MDAARGVLCACCGGLVVVVSESAHPTGVFIQHGRCADCGTRLWRLLDEQRVPLPDQRGRWTPPATDTRRTAHRTFRHVERYSWPAGRPAQRTDPTRPRR